LTQKIAEALDQPRQGLFENPVGFSRHLD